VLRAAVARALVGAGLHAGVGLFHSNRGDAFALASDLMEPYRPFVDGIAWELWSAGMGSGEINQVLKAHLLAALNLPVSIDGQTMPLSLALHRSASSLAGSFGERKDRLRLPDGSAGLPGSPDETSGAPSPAA
jgi:CRISPR-associated protein Cas1